MQRFPGFVNMFVPIAIAELSDAAASGIVESTAAQIELKVDDRSRRSLLDLTTRFLPARPQPGPALKLLAQVADYHAQKRSIGEHEDVSVEFVERVFSIYSGLPMFIVSRSETMPAREIRGWFEDRIIGQRDGIEAVVEAIALFKSVNAPMGISTSNYISSSRYIMCSSSLTNSASSTYSTCITDVTTEGIVHDFHVTLLLLSDTT